MRSGLDIDPNRPIVAPLPAATLLVLRTSAAGPEIFCVRRAAKSAFMGGAVVFPGGKLDAADGDPAFASELASGLHPRAALMADDAPALALAVCACREALEEAALLPCQPPLGDGAVQRMRSALPQHGFLPLLRQASTKLATDALVPFARWVTPESEARRFDARFFITALPEGQRGVHDAYETTHSIWATPARLLEAFERGDLWLAPPTLRCIELLEGVPDVAAAIALAAEQSLLPICPLFVAGKGEDTPPMLVIPGDPEHAIAEPRVAGGTRFVLRGDRFVSA